MTSVRWIRSIDDLRRSAPLLRQLAESSGRDQPAADPDFLGAYVDHFEYGPSPFPEIAIAEREGQAIGFLATRVGQHHVLGRVRVAERTLLVTHDHDRVNLVASPTNANDAATAIADALRPSLRRPAVDISGLVPGDALHGALHVLARKSPLLTAFDIDLPPYCSVPVRYRGVDEYFRALSKTMRSNVSRQTRRLFGAGEVGLITLRGSEPVRRFLPAYFDLEQRSWKFAARAGILRSPRRTAFFGEVVAGHAAYAPSVVGVTLDGALVAALLLGRFGTTMWALEMAFAEDHAELGAGQLLLVLAMREAIAADVTSIGFLQHFAYFKTRWLAEETAVVSTRVVRVGSPLHLRHVAGQALAAKETESAALAGRREALDQVNVTTHRPDDVHASVELLRRCLTPDAILTGDAAAAILPFPVR